MIDRRQLDETAEQCVLASVLADDKSLAEAVTILGPDDFHVQENAAIWAAMLAAYQAGEVCEPVALAKASGVDIDYLIDLGGLLGTGAKIVHYANMVREESRLRRVGATGDSIVAAARSGKYDAMTILDRAQARLVELASASASSGLEAAGAAVSDAMVATEEAFKRGGKPIGPTIGLAKLDSRLTGFKPASLNLIGARPSMGKTAFAINNITMHNAHKGATIAIFELEMTRVDLVQRLVAAESGLDLAAIIAGKLTAEQWSKYTDACAIVAGYANRLLIDDSFTVSPISMRSALQRASLRHKIDLIVVDYIQLMVSDKSADNRQGEITAISRALKGIAKDFAPVVALSQLSRAVEQRSNPVPILSDLRESGSLEQDADTVTFIHVDDEDNATFNIAKQRNGPVGLVSTNMKFRRAQTKFVEEIPGAPAGWGRGQGWGSGK